MNLIIVESPRKSKTISQFLGKDFQITATLGHIRDLPEKKFGVDIQNNFKPTYVTIPGKKEVIKKLKDLSKKSKKTIIATDPDREGEAIGWHVLKILRLPEKKYQRIVFHEITKEAIENALKNPRKIDMNLVNAQQARRILDRIVGYKLSPFLWRKVAKGLSAGRVQSVALRLIVEREREIQNFVPQEYWTIVATLLKIKDQKSKIKNNEFEALLIKKNGKTIPKLGIKTKKEAEKIVKDLKGAEYKVKSIEKKETKKNPLPPFTTSTLQQEAWKRFHWPAKMTMNTAQALYEKGLITYHRTDALTLSQQSLEGAKKVIIEKFGKKYWAGTFRKYKTKSKVAQEAHEAIRPSYPEKEPETLKNVLEPPQLKLYDLIWRRFIACQMAQAIFDSTVVEILAKNYIFRATGQILKFDGFLKVYPIRYEEAELPPLELKEVLKLKKLVPTQHFTQPPSRYTEATLIKELEKNGIGRPSTYAPIISVLQERNYVKKDEKKRFYPTEIGISVNDILVTHFPEIVDIKFTAKMEDNLDKIANGKKEWVLALKEFYDPFAKNLKEKYKEVAKKVIITEKKCPKCGAPLVIRISKFGRFYGCSNFPKCKYTAPFSESGIKCPKCKKGEIVQKKTKKGKIFYACNLWPECDFALWEKPTGKTCPQCGSLLVKDEKGNIKCSNKNCDYQETK